MRKLNVFFMSLALILTTSFTFAEKKPIQISPQATLSVQIILDTSVSDGDIQMVLKPKAEPSQYLSEPLPEYCLLNAVASAEGKKIEIIPGALVCVTEDKRILDGQVVGHVTGLPICNDCKQFRLIAGEEYDLVLNEPLELKLQIRADGQKQ